LRYEIEESAVNKQTGVNWVNWSKSIERLVQFLNDQSGATAIEYGLIAAGISVAIIVVVNALGTQLQTVFSTVASQLATAGK
jgi:pilus assembly protein Flp/PilA